MVFFSKLSSKLRYIAGSSFFSALDLSLRTKVIPFSSRFPVGWRFEHDLTRFFDGPPSVIIDAGANIGQTALRFNRSWKKARIYSFEPIEETYAKLVDRCNRVPNIECVRCALGNENKEVEIELSSNSELNSLLNESNGASAEEKCTETVCVRKLDDFLAERSIDRVDLLKIDVEGFELQVLEGARKLISSGQIRAVYAECGFLRDDRVHVHFSELDRYLQERDFRFSAVYEVYRWGREKRYSGFGNGLWLRTVP
jgi:FkbM family methyltransferase